MATPAYRRKTAWIAVYRKLLRSQAATKQNRAVSHGQTQLFDLKVRKIMDAQGVWNDVRHQYLAYARALDKSQRDMAWMVDLRREHQILRDRFERRNLDPTVLHAIDELVIYRTANR